MRQADRTRHRSPARVLINPADDAGPALSPDGLTLYFNSTRAGSVDLYVTSRASRAEPFGVPVPAVLSQR